jgi:hypothetical protein
VGEQVVGQGEDQVQGQNGVNSGQQMSTGYQFLEQRSAFWTPSNRTLRTSNAPCS